MVENKHDANDVIVKIPKGTIVDISGTPLRLTKSLYVKDINGDLVITNSSLTSNFDYMKPTTTNKINGG